jgi:hypothetical protein
MKATKRTYTPIYRPCANCGYKHVRIVAKHCLYCGAKRTAK